MCSSFYHVSVCACSLSLSSKFTYKAKMADMLKQAELGEVRENQSISSIERFSEKADIKQVDLDRIGEGDGYVLDEATLKQRLDLPADAVLKKAKDGKTVLIPQPRCVPDLYMESAYANRCFSDDPNDPLNWPEWRKSMVLLVIAIVSGCGDYSSATGSIAIIPQARQWHISPNTVNHATAGNVFMMGAGGLIVVWFSAFFVSLPACSVASSLVSDSTGTFTCAFVLRDVCTCYGCVVCRSHLFHLVHDSKDS